MIKELASAQFDRISHLFDGHQQYLPTHAVFAGHFPGRVFATAAAVALLDYCLENGLIPLWETTEDNTASRRLALKLGFAETESYPVYAIDF